MNHWLFSADSKHADLTTSSIPEFIASDSLPYLVGEIPGFQSLLRVLDPDSKKKKKNFGPIFSHKLFMLQKKKIVLETFFFLYITVLIV